MAKAQATTLREGVYAMVSGPAFESSAELAMLQRLGADAAVSYTHLDVYKRQTQPRGRYAVLGRSTLRPYVGAVA